MSGPTTSCRTAPTTDDSRRLLCVVDEYTRAGLAIVVAPRLRADDVLACRTQLFVVPGPPTSLRSDNGPEFTAHAVRSWLPRVGVTTLFIQPGSPWENGSGESFNSKLRDECLNGEIFTTLAEAKVLIARWRREYNEQRPHSALGYRPPPPTIEARPAVGLQELPPMTALTSNVVQRWGAGHTFRRRKAAFSLSPWLVARDLDGAPRFCQGTARACCQGVHGVLQPRPATLDVAVRVAGQAACHQGIRVERRGGGDHGEHEGEHASMHVPHGGRRADGFGLPVGIPQYLPLPRPGHAAVGKARLAQKGGVGFDREGGDRWGPLLQRLDKPGRRRGRRRRLSRGSGSAAKHDESDQRTEQRRESGNSAAARSRPLDHSGDPFLFRPRNRACTRGARISAGGPYPRTDSAGSHEW